MSAPSAWTIFWRTVIGRAYPRIIGAQREKSWVFFEIFLPLLSGDGLRLHLPRDPGAA